MAVALFAQLHKAKKPTPIRAWDWHDIEQFDHGKPEWEIREDMERRLAEYFARRTERSMRRRKRDPVVNGFQ